MATGQRIGNYKHGHGRAGKQSPEFKIWSKMKQRCHNPNDKSFADYGGRGIVVCNQWRDSFEQFFAHVGQRPSTAHSIERIENNGNYEPGNVRWATRIEQARNKRNSRLLTWDGKRQCVAAWAEELGISVSLLKWRLSHWGAVAAFTRSKRTKLVTFAGRTQTLLEWAAETGIAYSALYARLVAGWSPERALTEPAHAEKRNRFCHRKQQDRQFVRH